MSQLAALLAAMIIVGPVHDDVAAGRWLASAHTRPSGVITDAARRPSSAIVRQPRFAPTPLFEQSDEGAAEPANGSIQPVDAFDGPSALLHVAMVWSVRPHDEREGLPQRPAEARPADQPTAHTQPQNVADAHLASPLAGDLQRLLPLSGASDGLKPHADVRAVGQDTPVVKQFDALDQSDGRANLRPLLNDHHPQAPDPTGLEEALPVLTLADRFQSAARPNRPVNGDAASPDRRETADDRGQVGELFHRVSEKPGQSLNPHDALLAAKLLLMLNAIAMGGFITYLFLSFRDWVSTRPERRDGMRATVAAGVFTWMISVVAIFLIDAALK